LDNDSFAMIPEGPLPIEQVLPQLADALGTHRGAVLVAEPGAGKSTRVPLFLLGQPWTAGRRIVMLEPRRLAARSIARYMASLLGENVGETVGYRVRRQTRVSAATRIEVVTEGILTRMLQEDPSLEGVAAVIFDEFHERSLQADLGLALCLQAQELFRPDLRLLVMSATLEAEPVSRLLGGAPVIRSEGRSFPVETRYLGSLAGPAGGRGLAAPPALTPEAGRAMEQAVERAVRRAMDETEGDILVFLPGAREIRRTAERLADLETRGVRVVPLHGGLSHQLQDQALAPAPPGTRKVVLATSIAETSLTVPGIRVVVDSGWMRVSRFSPRTGMTRLETVRVSKASADQRRGRAGRLGPGVCYRLWDPSEEARFAPANRPEILEADLAPLALELALWGVDDPAELRWLDPPPAAALQQARELLVQLDAVTPAGTVTPHGRRMAELGLHPRLAHMILAAIPLGRGETACMLAALLEERDIFRGDGTAPDADLRARLEAVARGGAGSDPDAVRRVREEARYLMERAGLRPGWERVASEASGLLLAFAFPDRIAARRPRGGYLLRSGRGAAFLPGQSLDGEPYIVAAELDDKGPDSRILLAAPLVREELLAHFGHQLETEEIVEWDGEAKRVAARRRRRLGALVLDDEPLADPQPERLLRALLDGIRREGLGILPWSKAARRLRDRMAFMRTLDPGWPDVSDEGLLETLETWLGPYLTGMKSAGDLKEVDLAAALEGMLSWEQRQKLDQWAPTHITVPSGSRIPIDYSDPEAPALAVRLQEVFGLQETPRIAGGRVPLTMHLLSPAHRPVQVTRDLASFWREAYFEVRKELRGRYPKHHWPEDPAHAQPTATAKRRRPG